LSRLRTTGYVYDDVGEGKEDGKGKQQQRRRRKVDGWCSELLNPLSGQRGIVAQPLPFPVPAVYRVTLPIGAVIRRDVELSSPQVGIAPFGSLLKVTGRQFSEHPVDKCIERLKLAGNRGWISVRLNRPPPLDDLVVELVSADREFDPDAPGKYHAREIHRANEEESRRREQMATDNSSSADLSSVDETELSDDDGDDDQARSANGHAVVTENSTSSRAESWQVLDCQPIGQMLIIFLIC